jgi:hypothetical protein
MNDLLKLAMDAHGGLDRWNAVRALDVRASLTGYLYTLKEQPAGMVDRLFHVDAHAPAVTASPFGATGHVGHFRPDRVWATDGKGAVVDDIADPRATFDGQLKSRWSDLQLLYFNGYALWNYVSSPFLLSRPGFGLTERAPVQEAGETWRRLHVVFPDDVPTHSREQTFYFNEQGLLQRLDYVTDIAGGVAAHYTSDHVWFGGLLFPTLRRVVLRAGDQSLPGKPTAVLLQISDILVTDKE